MKVNDSTAVDSALQLQLMTKVFEEMAGDNDSFQLVLQSLTEAMSKRNLSNGQGLISDAADNKADNKQGVNTNIEQAISDASNKYGIDSDLIRAVIQQESDYDPYAKSSAGAEGLMQLMPGTARELGVTDSFDVSQNVNGGTKYLKELLNMYGNSKELALAAYNAGPGALKRKGVDQVFEISNLSAETRNYVQKVMKNYGK